MKKNSIKLLKIEKNALNICKANPGKLKCPVITSEVWVVSWPAVWDPLNLLNTRTHSEVCRARSGYIGAASRSLYSIIYSIDELNLKRTLVTYLWLEILNIRLNCNIVTYHLEYIINGIFPYQFEYLYITYLAEYPPREENSEID